MTEELIIFFAWEKTPKLRKIKVGAYGKLHYLLNGTKVNALCCILNQLL